MVPIRISVLSQYYDLRCPQITKPRYLDIASRNIDELNGVCQQAGKIH